MAGGWTIPRKRLEAAHAPGLLERVGEDLPPAETLARLIALMRAAEKALLLHEDPGGESARPLAETAERCAIRIMDGGLTAALAPPASLALKTEALSLRIELHELTAYPRIGNTRLLLQVATMNPPKAVGEAIAWFKADDPIAAYLHYGFGRFEQALDRGRAARDHYLHALETMTGARGRIAVLLQLIEARWRLGHVRKMEAESEELFAWADAQPDFEFEIGWANRRRAMAFLRRRDWPNLVEAARLSNYHLFRFGAPQASRVIAINYQHVARGMFEQREWGEAAQLARLSLKGLQHWKGPFNKAESLVIMAKCARRIKDRDGALRIVTEMLELAETTPMALDALGEARRLKTRLTSS